MSDIASWSERRSALRVPLHGFAVCHPTGRAQRGVIHNLSATGALLEIPDPPGEGELVDLELKLGTESGHVGARAVRVERRARRTRVAVSFSDVEPSLRRAIDAAIAHAIAAARHKPILVIDADSDRRGDLVTQLWARGMTPIVPTTPLEAIDLLGRTQLHVAVCLLAPSFGYSAAELRALVADSFPWVQSTEIGDDLDDTTERAVRMWSCTDVARLERALA